MGTLAARMLAMACGLLLTVGVAGSASAAGVRFRVELFGLDDAVHQGSSGTVLTVPSNFHNGRDTLRPSGAVTGDSYQKTNPVYEGISPWMNYRGQMTRLGLLDAAHTDANGHTWSVANLFAGADQAAGWTMRRDGAARASAWHFDGATIRQIGLGGDAGRPQSAESYDTPMAMNSAGQVAGVWQSGWRFIDPNFAQWAWAFDGAVTRRVGLPNVGEPPDSWAGVNFLSGFNERGQAAGYSDGGQAPGAVTRAWFYDGQATIPIGLTDARHTGPTGERASYAIGFNQYRGELSARPRIPSESGMVTGVSVNYSTDPPLDDGWGGVFHSIGQTAWLYRDGITRVVGLNGPEFVTADGLSYSTVHAMSEGGWTAGVSTRTDTDNHVAWIDDGAATRAIDLPGFDPSEPESYYAIEVYFVSDIGRAVGEINGPLTGPGPAVWTYHDGAARLLGLPAANSDALDERIENYFVGMIDDTHVLGATFHFRDGVWGYATPWIDDGAATQAIEIALPSDDPAKRQGYIREINAAGQVLGATYVSLDGEVIDNRPWLYDLSKGIVSIVGPAGDDIEPRGLTDDGWVYGFYGDEYDSNGVMVDQRAFVWHADLGMIDLADAAFDSLDLAGAAIGQIVAGGGGMFVGTAFTKRGDSLVFRAVVVPEPGAGVILAVMGLGACGVLRRALLAA